MHIAMFGFGLIALVVGACTNVDERAVRRACEAVLDDWHDAAAKADEARYFDHMSDDAVFLGTDATERWGKAAFREYAHPHFAAGKAWSFQSTRRELVVAANGDSAWFDEDLATPNLGPARGSGVLIRVADDWKIAQYNLAVTIPNERFDLVKEAASVEVLRPDDNDPLAHLGWLAGSWVVHKPDGTIVEETWSAPRAGSMVAFGRTMKEGRMTFYELLRIEVREGKVIYFAQPIGKDATEFAAVATQNPDEAIFENLAHDWPKRITYRKTAPGQVLVKVEGAPGELVLSWTWLGAVVARK